MGNNRNISLEKQYEKETKRNPLANYSQGDYSGYNDRYVKWLENKVYQSDGNQTNSKNANCAIFDVSKRYRFTMQDVDTNEIIIIDEDTERKAFRKAFRFLGEKKVRDRELNLVSKVDNVC